jgi:hypothetical protein
MFFKEYVDTSFFAVFNQLRREKAVLFGGKN